MPGQKRAFVVFSAMALLTVPASAALTKSPPPYGAIVMSVDEHFDLTDMDKSGALSIKEYVAISHSLKQQPESEARKDFAAMDMDGDGQLTYDEFYGEMPSALTV